MADSQNGTLSSVELAMQGLDRQLEAITRRKQLLSSIGHSIEYAQDAHANAETKEQKRKLLTAIRILEGEIGVSASASLEITHSVSKNDDNESVVAVVVQPNGVGPKKPRARVVELPPPPQVSETSEQAVVQKKVRKHHISISGQHHAAVKFLFTGKAVPKTIEELCEKAYGEGWRDQKFSVHNKGTQLTLPLGEVIGSPYEAQFSKGLVASVEEIYKFGHGDYDKQIAADEVVLQKGVEDIWKTKIRQEKTIRRALEAMGVYPKVVPPA